MRLLPFMVAVMFPALVLAQGYSAAPMIVGEKPTTLKTEMPPEAKPPVPLNFPEWAVTKAAENSTGEHLDIPPTPTSPSAPAPNAAPVAASPAAPESPKSPTSKLWPRDTVPIFMKACVGFHPVELFQPCECIITRLIPQMPHDEFLAESEAGTIEQDARLIAIRNQCVSAPRQRRD